MKNKLFIGLLTLSFGTFAQDTLKISSYVLEYDDLVVYQFGDTVSVLYDFTYDGAEENIPIKQQVNVINDVSHWAIDDSVLVNPTSLFTVGDPLQMRAQIKLDNSYFKGGNNTVVIWPEGNGIPTFTKDSIEMNVIIDEGNNIFLITPDQQKLSVINNELVVSNESNSKKMVQIFDLKGQLINKLFVGPRETSNIYLPSGMFILTTLSNNEKSATKVLVR